jgi:hypothetical protein
MKNLKYLFLIVMTFAIAISCTKKFDSFNTNPDAVATVSPDMLVTQVLKNAYRFWNPNPTDFSFAGLNDKYIARMEASPNGGQYYSPYPYSGFGSFKNLTDLKRMTEFAKGLPAEPSYQGLALFMKAFWGFQMTMDLGDVPYSEAGQAENGITRPKYDKQADVIASVLKDFQAAELLFAQGVSFKGDIMFNGDATKWRKLCNAMQLRVIQQISKKATADQKARFAAIVSANNLLTGNADMFKLTYSDNTNASHPFYTGESARIYDGVSKLVVDQLKTFQDRRLFYFAEPAAALISSGKLESDFAAYEGAPTEMAASLLAINNQAGKYSYINKRYTLFRTGDPMILFSYAEQCFIIAEAIEEGWITGSAQTYYENGVKANLSYYMSLPSAPAANTHGMAITQSYIDGYFTGAAAYATAGTKTDREKQIWAQRWLTEFFQGNGGYYKTFLRTGYPVYPLDPSTNMNPEGNTKYWLRLKYDQNELVTNPVNYTKAVAEQYGGFDGITQVPWWLK